MKEIEAWLREEAERRARTPLLEDALIGGRFFPYAAFRLRYFALRTMLAAALHAVKIILAFRFFSARSFAAILVVQSAATIASGFWWGSLEILRDKVREDYRNGRRRGLDGLIGQWLSIALNLGAVSLAAALLVPACSLLFGRGPSAADAFLAAILLKLALDFPTRAYHSGVYAVRRVYRPLASVVLAEILSFTALLATWPLLGLWSLPLASAVSSLTSAGLVFYLYGTRLSTDGAIPTEQHPVLPPRGPFRAGRHRVEPLADRRRFVRDHAPRFPARSRPRFRFGCPDPDLGDAHLRRRPARPRRFRMDPVLLFRPQTAGTARPAAMAGGIRTPPPHSRRAGLFGSLDSGVVRRPGVLWTPALDVFCGLRPVFLGRGLLAAAQMRAYAREAYGRLFVSGIAVLAGHYAAGNARLRDTGTLLRRRDRRFDRRGDRGEATSGIRRACRPGRSSLSGRLARPDEIDRRAGRRRFDPLRSRIRAGAETPSRRRERELYLLQKTAGIIAAKLGRRGAVTVEGQTRIVWHERDAKTPYLRNEWIFSLGAGRIRRLETTGLRADGREALRQAAEMGFFGGGLACRNESGRGRAVPRTRSPRTLFSGERAAAGLRSRSEFVRTPGDSGRRRGVRLGLPDCPAAVFIRRHRVFKKRRARADLPDRPIDAAAEPESLAGDDPPSQPSGRALRQHP